MFCIRLTDQEVIDIYSHLRKHSAPPLFKMGGRDVKHCGEHEIDFSDTLRVDSMG